jgi:predicted AlkP superfamily phosphohydrolase/phosphomutase
MKLVLTENEFHRLKDEVLIMPYGNGIYTVELRSGIKEVKKIEISIEIDDSHDVKSSNIADVKNAVSNFKQVQDEFPASDAFDNFPTTRSLTTDKNNAAISNYRDLLENHDFTHNQIIKCY